MSRVAYVIERDMSTLPEALDEQPSNAIPWRRRVVSIAVTHLGTRWGPRRPAGS